MKNIDEKLQAIIDSEKRKSSAGDLVLGVKSGDGRVNFSGVSAGAGPGDRFYVASITKLFTATVVIQLIDEGLVNLDTPVGEYLPGVDLKGMHVFRGTDYSQAITIRQLLNHTSGIADYYEGWLLEELYEGRDRSYGLTDVLDAVRSQQASAVPDSGKAYYSDTNYQLLGAVIETVCASSLAEQLSKRIFSPLSLGSTSVAVNGEQKSKEKSPLSLYLKYKPMEFPLALSSMAADGGIISTVSDLIRFMQGYFSGELFADSYFELIKQFVPMFFPMEYGLGLWKFQLPRWTNMFRTTPLLLGHSGSTGSFAFHEPDRDLYIAGSLNQMSNPARPYQLMLKILRAIGK